MKQLLMAEIELLKVVMNLGNVLAEMLQVVSPDTLRCNLSGVGEVTTDTNEVTDLVINRIDITI